MHLTPWDGVRVIRFVRSLLLLAGLAALPACSSTHTVVATEQLAPAVALQAQQAMPPADKVVTTHKVVIHFDSDSAEIRAAAMQTLYGAALDLRGAQLTAIRIIGHTDAAGRRAHNQKLSERRAAAVADQLVKLGIHAPITQVQGAGEVNGKGPRTARENRRVEIEIERVDVAQNASPPPSASSAPSVVSPVLTHSPALLVPAVAPLSGDVVKGNPAPTRLHSAAKPAIKRNLLLAGPAWLRPNAA